jgi:tyrosine-protein kinase Etk/Wzc
MDKKQSLLANDTIDLNKLKAIFLKNIFWIILLFCTTNLISYFYIRYTKEVFEAWSEIKLEIRSEANDFGITKMMEDQNANILSGEIELIQSNLFIERVIDSLDIKVTYYSVGEINDFELYGNSPFSVTVANASSAFLDVIHKIKEIDEDEYLLQLANGNTYRNFFGRPLVTDDFNITITKSQVLKFENYNSYSFIVNSDASLKAYFRERLKVEPKNFNANIIRISFNEFNATKASDVVNKIVDVYLIFSNEQKNFANKHKIDWVSNELKQVEKKMAEFEEYFKNYTLENKTPDATEDLKIVLTQLSSLDTQRFVLASRQRAITLLKESLQDNTRPLYLGIADRDMLSTELTTLVTNYQKLINDLEKLKISYKEETFAYKELQQQVQITRTQVLAQLHEMENSLAKQMAALNTKKRQLSASFTTLPDKVTEYAKNQRYYKLYEGFYFTMMQSRSEFEISQAGSVPNFKILSRASAPSIPIYPNKLMVQAAGFVAGCVLIFFLIGVLYLMDDKITSIHELEKNSEVTILGIIPSFRYSKKDGLPVVNHTRSMVSEAIRTLRTNLDFFSVDAKNKVISVTSTVSGEGKSFVARNLGAVIALSNKRVLLLDLDMRKPKDDQPYPFNNSGKGISSVLINKANWQECIQKSSIENFDVIPAGPHPPNPSELLVNGVFHKLVEEFRAAYDFVIMDTPPVGIVTDGIMAMKQSDISIYLFRANYSKKEFLYNLDRVHKLHHIKNLTAVLNALPDTAESYGYGYYHEVKSNKPWYKFGKA